MGTVIDLFTRQKVQQGEEAPVVEEFVDEAEFVDEFIRVHMGDFQMEVTALEDATSIEALETQIKRIKRLVSKWPRMPNV